MKVALSAAILVALAVGSGCGSGGRDEGAKRTTAQRTQDAAAESMLLKLSDLPDGWRVIRGTAVNPAWFRNCIGVIYGGAPRIGEASSTTTEENPDRGMGEVTSAATVFGSESEASESFRAAAIRMEGSQSPGASSCIAASVDRRERRGDPGDVHELSVVAPANVDEVEGWRIGRRLDEVKPPHDVVMDPASPAYLDWLVLRQGETIVELFTYDVPGPFDSDLRDQLMKTLASRLAGNAGAE